MTRRKRIQHLTTTFISRLLRGLSWAAAYAGWMLAFRLLVLTFITYFLMSSVSNHGPKFEDISEALGANEVSLMGLGAALFVLILRAFHPVTSTTTDQLFSPTRIEKYFIPGFAHGGLLAAGISFAFLVGGYYRYLGIFTQFDEAPLAAITVLARIAAFGAFAYFEEFIFRYKITQDLEKQLWGPRRKGMTGQVFLAVLIGLVYCGIKTIQFDLGVMQMITMFLISVALSTRTALDGDFARGAGFWTALLIVLQPVLSLPVLGSDFSGIVLIKHQPIPSNEETSDLLARLITGGAGGPLSSISLQFLLMIDIVRGLLLQKKRLES